MRRVSRSKYGAVPKTIDNVRFQSTAEARRYLKLKLLLKAGTITDLELQPRFPLHVTNDTGRVHVGTYVGDFSYREAGQRVIEDVKGVRTAMYRLKRKMVEAEYGITITEVV